MLSVEKICVCGAGTMGSGIVQVSAQAGFTTIQFDIDPSMLTRSRDGIEKNLQFLVDKGKIGAAEKESIIQRISFTSDIRDCVADVIIEAIVEKPEAKQALFNQLLPLNHAQTIFATNTSSIAVEKIAAGLSNPGMVAGMHFFNPAPLMKLVEIIKAPQTREEVIETLVALSKKMNKTPVVCKDAPGFIVNHVARPYYLEAMQLVEQGLAEASSIDAVMEASGFKMGPFKLMDLIGMDVNYSVSNIVWEALGRPERLKPSVIQQQKVEAGELGRKTGKGFYHY